MIEDNKQGVGELPQDELAHSLLACVNRAIISLRDGWGDRNDADEAVKNLADIKEIIAQRAASVPAEAVQDAIYSCWGVYFDGKGDPARAGWVKDHSGCPTMFYPKERADQLACLSDHYQPRELHVFAASVPQDIGRDAAPVSVDTLEFRNLLRNYGDTIACSTDVIDYVDRHTARAVAANGAQAATEADQQLSTIREAILTYYDALTSRHHAGVAQATAFEAIQVTLGMSWQFGVNHRA